MTAHVDPTGQHAVYAPSSAHRWTVCTASASAIAKLPQQEEGEEARQGTEAHEEIERCLGHIVPGAAISPEAWPMQVNAVLVNPDHPAAYGVSLVLDYVRQLPPGRLWIEQRVTLTPEIWGRCDIAHWDDATATLTIVDFKNGFVDVQAEENEQLQIYAAASIYTHNLPAKWIRLVVVQPNSFMPVPRVKQWVTSAEDLHAFASKAAAIPGGTLEFKAGEQCRYCPMFGLCPASQDVLTKFNHVVANPPDTVSPDQAAIFMACKKPIEDWFKSLDKALTKKALGGATIPGMKVVQTVNHRAWRPENVDAVKESILTKFGMDAFDPPTPAQAEKLGMDKAWVETVTERPDGGPALAFESDKRPTFARKSAAEMFAGVTGAGS